MKKLPAILNSLSTRADDNGIPRTYIANFDNFGDVLAVFQKLAGFMYIDAHEDSKYALSPSEADSLTGSSDCSVIKLNNLLFLTW